MRDILKSNSLGWTRGKNDGSVYMNECSNETFKNAWNSKEKKEGCEITYVAKATNFTPVSHTYTGAPAKK